MEKTVPRSWINDDGDDVTDEMIKYLRPLITDEHGLGIPPFFTFM